MNRQEIFDKVATSLMKQAAPSYDNENAICVYLMDDGKRCAAGWLIPDDLIQEVKACYNRAGSKSLSMSLGDRLPSFFSEEQTFISDLQSIHDHTALDYKGRDKEWLPAWKDRMKKFAKHQGLSTKVLEN